MTAAFTVVIPARYGSSRFPGKPLKVIAGKPMVQLVWEQARKSSAERVVVATDDQRIFDACQLFGAEVLMTRDDHNSGTDRLAEVAAQLGLAPDAIVVNVQGDEPMIPPAVIDQVADNLAAHPQARMSTLAEPIDDVAALFNPNVVKVTSDINGLALTVSSCQPACPIVGISGSTPIAPVSSLISSAGARAGSKTRKVSSNCVPFGTACVSMWPMPWKRHRLGSIPPKTWSA
jgi:3-deoxy-D-manno-octulosonate cytidylyltransferase